MNKYLKIIALILICILTLGMISSCTSSSSEDETGVAKFTVGLPFDETDERWESFKENLEYYQDISSAEVTVVKTPTDPKELKKFVNKLKSGKVAMIYCENNEYIQELIDGDYIMSVSNMREKWSDILANALDSVLQTSLQSNKKSYLYPICGSYQGLYINNDVFKSNGVKVPSDWNSFIKAIRDLNNKKVTPISSGFKDNTGLGVVIDELVLSEGGVSEHAYSPKLGVINSWERAITDLRNLYNAGAFSDNCLDITYEESIKQFKDKKAAMIIADSKAMGDIDKDNVTIIPFPVTPTGSKQSADIVANFNKGFYISRAAFLKTADSYIPLTEFISTLMDTTDGIDFIVDDGYVAANIDNIPQETTFDKSLYKFASPNSEGVKNADSPMKNRIKTFDDLVAGAKEIMTNNKSINDFLIGITDKEIAAKKESK